MDTDGHGFASKRGDRRWKLGRSGFGVSRLGFRIGNCHRRLPIADCQLPAHDFAAMASFTSLTGGVSSLACIIRCRFITCKCFL